MPRRPRLHRASVSTICAEAASCFRVSFPSASFDTLDSLSASYQHGGKYVMGWCPYPGWIWSIEKSGVESATISSLHRTFATEETILDGNHQCIKSQTISAYPLRLVPATQSQGLQTIRAKKQQQQEGAQSRSPTTRSPEPERLEAPSFGLKCGFTSQGCAVRAKTRLTALISLLHKWFPFEADCLLRLFISQARFTDYDAWPTDSSRVRKLSPPGCSLA